MEQNRKNRGRIAFWLTSAAVTLAVFAPQAAFAVEIYIQKPGH